MIANRAGFLFSVFIVISIIVVCILGYIYWNSDSSKIPPAQFELYKTCLSFLLTGFMAVVGAALLKIYESERQNIENRRQEEFQKNELKSQFLRDFYLKLLSTYNSIKLIRRILRAKSEIDTTASGGKILALDNFVYIATFEKLE